MWPRLYFQILLLKSCRIDMKIFAMILFSANNSVDTQLQSTGMALTRSTPRYHSMMEHRGRFIELPLKQRNFGWSQPFSNHDTITAVIKKTVCENVMISADRYNQVELGTWEVKISSAVISMLKVTLNVTFSPCQHDEGHNWASTCQRPLRNFYLRIPTAVCRWTVGV